MTTAIAQPPHLVWISLDTTRADALSCYAEALGPQRRPDAATPNLDALAAEGVRFTRFFANAPSTLSSHTTMFTGLDPHEHAVVRNGFPVDPGLPTLAERLAGQGYDTIAILGAAALERSMGLDRGFRIYDDAVPALQGLMFQDDASGVVRRTLTHLDGRPDPQAPLFLMVHFYDPHTPYAPPQRFVDRFTDPDYAGAVEPTGDRFKAFARAVRYGQADPADIEHMTQLYLGEVAYVDEQIGVLVEALGARGLLDRALLVAVADHGETLADQRPYAWSHGSNVAWEVMRVPLVVRGYDLPIARHTVIDSQASMDGLAPSVERALGLDGTLGDGHPFDHLWRAGPVLDVDGWPDRPTLPVFAEATRPRPAEGPTGWNNAAMHRGVWAGGWGAYRAPFLEHPLTFYDHGGLPHADVLDTLSLLLDAWDADAPDRVEADMAPATVRALRALGYLE